MSDTETEHVHDESRVKVGNALSAVIVGALLLVWVAPFLWLFSGEIFGLWEINSATAKIRKFEPGDAITEKVTYGGNTFTDEVSSRVIGKAYHKAARALAKKGEVNTYLWEDWMGWPRVSTVLQNYTGYIEVRASSNNDNDSVYVGFIPGEFERDGAKRLDSYELPDWILRDDG